MVLYEAAVTVYWSTVPHMHWTFWGKLQNMSSRSSIPDRSSQSLASTSVFRLHCLAR